MTRYSVTGKARSLTKQQTLDVLENRKYVGIPLRRDIQEWMGSQPPRVQLTLDFSEVRASNASVTEELGPLLMQEVQLGGRLDHRYPVYLFGSHEMAYNFAAAFASVSLAALATVPTPLEPHPLILNLLVQDSIAYVILGQLSKQMEQILRLADRHWVSGSKVTSEDLTQLDFLADVGSAARSKRLTELYIRRLMAFEENPRNQKERLFTPAWRLPNGEHGDPTQELL